MAYSVAEKLDLPAEAEALGAPTEHERVYGSLTSRDGDRHLAFVVSPDRRLYGAAPLTLYLRCKGPD